MPVRVSKPVRPTKLLYKYLNIIEKYMPTGVWGKHLYIMLKLSQGFLVRLAKAVIVGSLLVLPVRMVAGAPVPDELVQVKIGVLAFRGKGIALARWQPTADYLTAKLPGYQFSIIPLTLPETEQAIKERLVDFVLTNTGHYVDLEYRYGITRLLTLRNRHGGNSYTHFGAVIFTRSDREDIKTINDLRGKSFMAVKPNAFGGFQMAWYELNGHGIDPYADFSELVFSGLPQDQIPLAVLKGRVDAGTVRTHVLERMAESGQIQLDKLRILNPRRTPGFPFVHTTALYPEWPISALPHVPATLSEKVGISLLQLPALSLAAVSAKSAGWTVPQDYTQVHRMMRELSVGPYANDHVHPVWDMFKRYWIVIAVLLVITIPTFWAYVISLYLNYRRVENARQRAESEWLQGMDLMSEPTTLLDLDDTLVKANSAFYVTIGKTPEEAVGHKITDYFHPDGEDEPCPVCRARQSQQDAVITVEADEPHNRMGRPMEITVRIVHDNSGKPARIIQSIRDLTEIRQRERMLKQENELLHYIVEATSAEHGNNFFQPLVKNLADTLGAKFVLITEVVNPDEVTRVRTLALWAENNFGENVEYDLKGTPCEDVVNKDVAYFPENIQEQFPDDEMLVDMGVHSYLGIPFQDSAGRPLGHIAVLNDRALIEPERAIALIRVFAVRAGAELERLRAETALKESEERFKGLFDTAPDPAVIVNEDGVIQFVNSQFTTLFGYEKLEAIGKPIEVLLPERFRKMHPSMRKAYIASPEARPMGSRAELEGIRKDGSVFPVEIALSPLRSKGEIFVTAVIRDVTDRKAAERELERLASFPMMSPFPIFEIDMSGSVTYENPVSSRLFPDLRAKGLDHPLLQGISEYRDKLKGGEPSIVRDVVVEGQYFEQQISYIEENERLRVYSWDVTSLHEVTQKMAYQASHDALTGLLNRREFEQQLERAIQRAVYENVNHALCYIDLDQFKVVNDVCGHSAGDELLRQLSVVLKKQLRESDALARLGGDEFGLLLTGCPLGRAEELADRLRRAVAEFVFIWERQSFAIGASIGLVEINQACGGLEAALKAADSACFAAKELGRNRIYTYHPDDKVLERNVSEMNWTTRIRTALSDDRFVLFYQPIVSLEEDDELHCEILIRMVDDKGRIVLPGAFIPAAERFGMMGMIDRWVVKKTIKAIEDQRLSEGTCSINLSGQTLGDPTAMNYIVDLITESGIDPDRLCFEITETAMITSLGTAEKYIRLMRGMGCLFALDDFGSGLSSFSYLKTLPVDRLKIDAHFIRDVNLDEVSATMIESINQVGHAMKLSTVAEGVEDRNIMPMLRKIGIDYVQGFAIARPEPVPGQPALNLPESKKAQQN